MNRTARAVRKCLVLAAATGMVPLPALAQVQQASDDSFTVRHSATIAAAPGEIYEMLLFPGRWWHPDHTWSGVAESMTIEGHAGGCFCESLPNGGSVTHLTVTHAAPGELLRFSGALGPLQEYPLAGSMTWSLAPDGNQTVLTFTYRVAGHVEGGLEGWADPVSGVIKQQLDRLARLMTSGSPDPG